ncbi:hypothetical protein RIR_jg1478.t1 [Rhizophagus irregularis DAOM 181602=DAOM 197198]|nr:hypothetical protein RIR_jg1478.t1 [Rhizophagus irregularis DAOM 181602=DAOM 197198]
MIEFFQHCSTFLAFLKKKTISWIGNETKLRQINSPHGSFLVDIINSGRIFFFSLMRLTILQIRHSITYYIHTHNEYKQTTNMQR